MATETETVWYRHKTQGTLHEVVKGSDGHKRLAREVTEVDEDSDEVPEPVYERVAGATLAKLQESPEKLPGYFKPRQRKQEGPVDVDALVAARVAEALASAGVTSTGDTPPAGK